MTKLLIFFVLLMAAGYGNNFVLDNQTSYPVAAQKSKIAIEWASSAKEVAQSNEALISGMPPKHNALQTLSQAGKITINIPKGAEYFRIVVWSKNGEGPDYLTNWVDVVADKTYTLKSEYLIPTVLMVGMGC
jgi:hypothetical protein